MLGVGWTATGEDGTGVEYTGVPTETVTTGIVTVPGAVIVCGTELTVMVVGSGQYVVK